MAIRFYINGTQGAKDGTEVTAANPIVADGMYPSGSTAASKSVKVCIRADEGESYNQVMVGVKSEYYKQCRITSMSGATTQTINNPSNRSINVLKTVTDTNQVITLTFYASSTETGTVDTSIKLYAIELNLVGMI